MWPKLLLEYLPHLTRLLPAADKYFSSRGESDHAHQAALTAFGDEFRGSLRSLSEEQAALRRQIQEQGASFAEIGVDATRTRLGMESVEARIAALENRLKTVVNLLVAALVLLVAATALLVVRILH